MKYSEVNTALFTKHKVGVILFWVLIGVEKEQQVMI